MVADRHNGVLTVASQPLAGAPADAEFRRGWRSLSAAFLGMACGINSLFFYSLGLFILPLAQEFDWSRGEASLGSLVAKIGAAVAAPLVGGAVDRVGAGRAGLFSLAGLGVSFILLATLTSGLGIYLALMLLLAVVGLGSSPLGFGQLVVGAFDRRRGLALGLAITGTGVGGVLVPLLLNPYIASAGWRAGYVALGAIALAAVLPVFLLLRGNEPTATAKPNPAATGAVRSIYRDPIFWTLGGVFLFASLGAFGVLLHFPALLSDAGLSPAEAGALTAAIGISVMASRIGVGLLLDRLPANIVASGVFLLAAAGLVMLAMFGIAVALPAALLLGLSIGAEIDLMAYLVSRHFQLERYGRAYGGTYGCFLTGAAIAPALVGYQFDWTGSYVAALYTAASSLVAATALLLFALPAALRRAAPEPD